MGAIVRYITEWEVRVPENTRKSFFYGSTSRECLINVQEQ